MKPYLFLFCSCRKAPSPTSKPASNPNPAPKTAKARVAAENRINQNRHAIYNLAINQEAIGNIALSPDGRYACTISQTGGPGETIRHDIIRAWDLSDPAVIQEIASLDPIDGIQAGGNSTSILFDPDYTRLVFTRDDHTSIGFWDFSSGQLDILRLPSALVKDAETGELLAIVLDQLWFVIPRIKLAAGARAAPPASFQRPKLATAIASLPPTKMASFTSGAPAPGNIF